MRLEIDPVIARVDEIVEAIDRDLPTHPGLARVARSLAQVTRDAKEVSRRLKRPIGWHRLPAVFLVLALLCLGVWAYWLWFHTSRLTVAVPERDAIQLKTSASGRVQIDSLTTVGSQASIEKLNRGEVDLAFIQGGIDIPDALPRTELDQSELVLLFLRQPLTQAAQMRKVLTSAEEQGSHRLAQRFTRVWGNGELVEYVHDWRLFTDDKTYDVAADVDGVFVVKDPMSDKLEGIAARLAAKGFRLVSPDIGAASLRLDFLRESTVRPGYLDPTDLLPAQAVETYSVTTYLVAREGLSDNEMAVAQQLVRPDRGFPVLAKPSLGTASDVAQGIEAAFGIVIYIGIAFLALLGLDVVAYRKRFHELNSIVSLVSMHQSTKDVIGGSRQQKAHNVSYLAVCSDLLGIIAVVTGYYTQENSSLMYNGLSDIIQERCSSLKLNIQLKILQALIDLPIVETQPAKLAQPKNVPVATIESGQAEA